MSLAEQEWAVFRKFIFPEFEKKYHIKIRSYQIESSQLPSKLMALSSAKRTYIDLFAQDNMNIANLVREGLVLDLTEYQAILPDELLPNLIDACRFKGRLMFLPFRPNVQIVYYNKEAFEKYNLDIPKTWDALLDVAKKFYEYEGRGRVLIKGYGGAPTATQLYEFILQGGGDPYTFDDEGCIRTFNFLQRLSPYLSVESKRAKWDTTNDILARREAYIAQNWPYGSVVLVEKYGLDFIKSYSGWDGPAGEFHVIGGDVFGIPKDSKNKDLALKFVLFIYSEHIQQLLLERLGWPSARVDVYGEAKGWQKDFFNSVKEALQHGRFRRNIIWWPIYEKFITEAFREIVIEGEPVKETLKRYKLRMEKEKAKWL